MAGSSWTATVDEAKVREGSPVAVYPKGVGVLLVRLDGELHAIRNKCAHMACPLEEGLLEGPILTCPCHDWRFDVRSGEFLDAPELSIPVYATRVEDGKVLVDLTEG
ncbi:MAG TPA: Rieske (2Fe-2S) protein [Thermoleophilia bacterium]|nr:Rieske (2Fe-2S) protein [Thermoleophilia bacterium]